MTATSEMHTPGPLSVDGNWIMSGHLHVATIPRAHDGDWLPANAARIVLTWNCHDELVAALRAIAETRWDYSAAEACLACIQADARAALSRATSPTP